MKNALNFILVLSFLLIGSFYAGAEELKPEMFLYKVTKRLTGHWPVPEEYEDLTRQMQKTNCQRVSCLDSYFRKVIQNKMKSDEFAALFYSAVTERWGYKAPQSIKLEKLFAPQAYVYTMTAKRDFALVYHMLKNNLSFDSLYTSQLIIDPDANADLELTYGDVKYSPIDLEGFKDLYSIPRQQFSYAYQNGDRSVNGVIFDLRGHNNISGLFSSATFWNRYWNTSLNQERKRAAQFYKIMLCDPMSPALDRESEKQREMRMSRGVFDEDMIKKDLQIAHANKHASQKDCAACHSRLDPVGYSFRAIENGVSNYPVAGWLKIGPAGESQQVIETKSFHDLTVKTTQLPKYFDCQLNWLMSAMLGQDLKVPTMRMVQLSKEIEGKGRKIKDVVETLMMLPEFRDETVKFEEVASMTKAKEVLSNCAECHSNFFNLRPELLKVKLERVSVCLDLKNNGAKAAMPPDEHRALWSPTVDELKDVKSWIEQGAPITNEFKLYNQTEVQKILNYDEAKTKCRN